eukprot:Skav232853  [mRNA]  locus=scaffold2451:1779:2363:- [translate_table: standard]
MVGGGKSGSNQSMVLRGVLKDKASKKEAVKSHALKVFNEIDKNNYQIAVLADAQKFLRVLNSIDEAGSAQVFTQAVQMLDADGVAQCIKMFDPKSKTPVHGTTEEKLEAFASLAMKQRLEPLDTLVNQVNELKVAMMSRLLVLYSHFGGSKTDRYNNTPLLELLRARKNELASQAKTDDENMSALAEMMSATKI